MSARSTGQQHSVMVGSLAGNDANPTTSTQQQQPSASSSSSANESSAKSSEDSGRDDQDLSYNLLALGIEVALRFVVTCASGYLLLWLSRKFFPLLLPADNDDQQDMPASAVYRRLAHILSKRNNGDKQLNEQREMTLPELSRYERQMAQEIVDPDDIECEFKDIGGLDATKREIYELAILPLVRPHLFKGKLVQPCKGILLYGRPGTGKTMLAKALAKEAHAVFLPLQLSKILNKWVGESNKLIAATFSLADKLQPAIIFIDELDTFLKAETSETAYLDSIKAEFLTLWDGVSTSSNSRVLVLGASNKPQTIDSAILRRMPRAFHVPLPNEQGRLSILTLILQDENIAHDVMAFLPELVKLTSGYSGSDLKELCKAAAMVSVQERTEVFARERVMGLDKKKSTNPSSDGENNNFSWSNISGEGEGDEHSSLRPISKDDLLMALKKVRRTGEAAHEYGRGEGRRQQRRLSEEDLSINPNSILGLTALLRSLSVLSDKDDTGNNNCDEDSVDDNMPSIK